MSKNFLYYCRISIKEGLDIEIEKAHLEQVFIKHFPGNVGFVVNFLYLLKTLKKMKKHAIAASK